MFLSRIGLMEDSGCPSVSEGPIATLAAFGKPEIEDVRTDDETGPQSGAEEFHGEGGQFDAAAQE